MFKMRKNVTFLGHKIGSFGPSLFSLRYWKNGFKMQWIFITDAAYFQIYLLEECRVHMCSRCCAWRLTNICNKFQSVQGSIFWERIGDKDYKTVHSFICFSIPNLFMPHINWGVDQAGYFTIWSKMWFKRDALNVIISLASFVTFNYTWESGTKWDHKSMHWVVKITFRTDQETILL